MVITSEDRNTPANIASPLSLPLHALLIAMEMLFGAASHLDRNDLYQSEAISDAEKGSLSFFCPFPGTIMGSIAL